jgi:hypothetical protein
MWHDLFVEQITLSEKVIRTIEDSEGQLTSSRTGWLLNIADAIWCGHMEPPRGAVFTRYALSPCWAPDRRARRRPGPRL